MTGLNIKLKINLDGIVDELNDTFLKQIPFVSMLALNETVFKTAADVKKTMPYFIQGGPIPFTKRGVQYKKAKSKRHLHAEVFIPDAQWKYMRWVIDGGTKRWNKSKHGIGVPVNARLNKYGNIPGRKRKEGTWRDLLNQKRGQAGAPRGKLGKNEFVGTVKGITGVWKRLGKGGRSALQLLVSISRDPADYKSSFPFRKFATKFGRKHFKKSFNKKLLQVINKEAKRLRIR